MMNMLPSIGRPEPLHNRSSRPSDGQIIKGKVIQLLNAEEAIVEINGRTIKASIEVPLKPGSSYLFQVFREPEGFHLKMIKEIPMGEVNFNDSAEDLVRYFGLPADGRSKALVKLFYQYNWPLNSAMLNQARRLLNLLNHKGDWDALKMILEKKWPLNESLFKALTAIQNKQTAQQMNALLHELKQPHLASSLHENLASLLENWPSLSEQGNINEVMRGFRAIGADQTKEEVLKQWLIETYPKHEDSIKQGWPEARTLLGKMSTSQDLKAFIQLIGLPFNEDEFIDKMANKLSLKSPIKAFSGEWLKNVFAKTGYFYEAELVKWSKGQDVDMADLKQTLKGLLMALAHQDADKDDAIQQSVQQLLQQINGQQLQSLHTDRSFVQLLFTFPLRFEDGLRDVHLFWEGKRKKDGGVDSEYCKIAFRLDLPHLNETVVHVLVQKRRVTVSVFNDNPLVETLIHEYSDGLAEKLRGIGYDLVSVKQHVGNMSEARAIFSPNAGNVDVRI